jgi:aldehyde dehydrogenase (NAD+)|uniref:Aldehyde dehydrogenase domain-containing protein n=1 Tax=Eutreptiella gymnastica TaxID=73025 RepID=A0A6T1ZL54_9EUGL|eukprot:CAMPEP_0174280114 /NCGR_PEP_ID=MMETSP0809-20121228/382_1 /TAXON_ID=73025 ORGANISM="Eutreptiella gymnastica-like, Strain CCMP1594" /NCGR_SAMPLE_ID=MMETSP0809 /ASSEMBLY_ACC=CAM_ASM_000658 /LENGTH=485 /DNA_ID=CAMNT_0015372811 /DNA_START=25 /DNA_END=1482 /DNA_ORIENTATION=-
MPVTLRTQHFINNEWVNSVNGGTLDTINPATEEVLATVQAADKADVDIAVAAAKKAFFSWRDVPGPKRRDLLLKLADLIDENKQELAEWESKDNGKPVSVARDVDVTLAAEHFRYFAGWADKGMQGKTIPVTNTNSFAMTVHEPIGIVGCIIPWNFPIVMLAWKWAPLIACGCTCVMKSSEKTPLTALMMCDLALKAGFPPGVLNVLSGMGPDAGDAICRHPDIAKVCFTGSSAVGHKIAEVAAQSPQLPRVTLELGGKSPLIVCEDADLDEAANVAHIGLFLNHGQCCCASSRILVHESVHDEFVKKCVAKAEAIKLGVEEGKDQGPQVDKLQFDKVMSYIQSGKDDGAKCMIGGARAGNKGYFVQPTVFADVKDNMKIAQEEIFGPVMQLMKYKTIEEAVERANATNYGLAAGICGKDIGKVMGIAKRLNAGTVWINCYDDFDAAIPFGGFKASGYGREKSEYALKNFTEVKCIQFPIANIQA